MTRKKNDPKTHRSDLKYKEIRRLLMRKEREKRENVSQAIEEIYVDSSRMISVQMGGKDDDLKTMMQISGIKTAAFGEINTGEPDAKSYVKLAHYHMRAGRYEPALYYLEVSLAMDTDSEYAMSSLAKCHLMMGHWMDALKASEIVMKRDRKNTMAIQVKAEALYNTCFFEHALVLFYRGRILAPDNDKFRLGIQKCIKTIQDTVSGEGIFQIPGMGVLFRLLSAASEMHSQGVRGYSQNKKKGVSFKGVLSGLASRNKGAGDGKEGGGGGLSLAKRLKAVGNLMDESSPPVLDEAQGEAYKEQLKDKAKSSKGKSQGTSASASKPKEEGKKKKPKGDSSIALLMKASTSKKATVVKRPEPPKKAKDQPKPKSKFSNLAADRLLEDKLYLSLLAEGGIGESADLSGLQIQEDVASEAKEALDFLNTREKFWDQLDMGKEKQKTNPNRVLSANHGIFAENDPPMVKNWAGATEGKTTKLVIPDELRDQGFWDWLRGIYVYGGSNKSKMLSAAGLPASKVNAHSYERNVRSLTSGETGGLVTPKKEEYVHLRKVRSPCVCGMREVIVRGHIVKICQVCKEGQPRPQVYGMQELDGVTVPLNFAKRATNKEKKEWEYLLRYNDVGM